MVAIKPVLVAVLPLLALDCAQARAILNERASSNGLQNRWDTILKQVSVAGMSSFCQGILEEVTLQTTGQCERSGSGWGPAQCSTVYERFAPSCVSRSNYHRTQSCHRPRNCLSDRVSDNRGKLANRDRGMCALLPVPFAQLVHCYISLVLETRLRRPSRPSRPPRLKKSPRSSLSNP